MLGIRGREFVLDGAPFRILAGALHYFRVVPEYWDDRLEKLCYMGLNTVDTYVPWNLHEPEPGLHDFTGRCDLVRFLRIAAEKGLHVILRPGPYICAEWDFGGLPAWLLRDPTMRVRSRHEGFLAAVDEWFDTLMPLVTPLQCTRGGPIIAMQVENEYGSHGNDRGYMEHIERALRNRGVDVLLLTSDAGVDVALAGGSLPDVLATVNFGTEPSTSFEELRRRQPGGPLMCMEFWHGWYDHWGGEHHSRQEDDVVETLERILAAGASVNLYMFHGGTNFGFRNGATCVPVEHGEGRQYRAVTTSYDYCAVLDETGGMTSKYHALRRVITRYAGEPDVPEPETMPVLPERTLKCDSAVDIWSSLDVLGRAVEQHWPETMESVGQDSGFILYRTSLQGPLTAHRLCIDGLADRAQVFVDGKPVGVLHRNDAEGSVIVDVSGDRAVLDVLVENMGRINYGPGLGDRKGIGRGVRLWHQYLHGWTVYALTLRSLDGLSFGGVSTARPPAFYRYRFEVPEPADTNLALPGFEKGVVWINGFNLGRYWSIGPQRTLYLPGPLLRRGTNELIVFEQHACADPRVELRSRPDLG